MEDFEIIELYWQRNQNAIKETDLKYGNYLYTISINILRNKEDTEECLNDTYFKAWNNIPPQIPTTFRVYLGKIIRNISFDCNKKKNSKKRKANYLSVLLSELEECIPSYPNFEKELEDKEIAKEISIFLKEQTKDKQLIF